MYSSGVAGLYARIVAKEVSDSQSTFNQNRQRGHRSGSLKGIDMIVKSLTIALSLSASALALSSLTTASADVTTISCPDISLPVTNENHYFVLDADEGTCSQVSSESEHPENGYNMYSYFYEYQGFTITETRAFYYRDGQIDETGNFKLGCQQDHCSQEYAFTDGAGLAQSVSFDQSYSGRSVTNISAELSAPTGPCNGLSGYYGNVTNIIVGEDGETVNVTMTDDRAPAYGTCSGNELTVNFADVGAVVSGTFDGSTIHWSNGTSWTEIESGEATGTAGFRSPRSGACNGVTGYYGNVTSIIVGQDGETVNVHLDDGRPNAYGTCSGNQITVNFADFNTVVSGTISADGIRWNNGTSWMKQ